jgi:leader peptidase (prepilin peptidase) / N-methyltransferase
VNLLLGLPLELRLISLAILGLLIAGPLNLAVYRWAWNPRWISPWSNAPELRRIWADRVPLVGWYRLRRESLRHGAGFWVRPLLVEVGLAITLPGLYYWDVVALGWLPQSLLQGPAPAGHVLTADHLWAAHLQFISHSVLLVLMLVASLIDLDEKTIPDLVTVPGAIIGLALAASAIWTLPLSEAWFTAGRPPTVAISLLSMSSPNPCPAAFLPGTMSSLWIALGCWFGWCFALLPRRWRARRGYRLAVAIFVRRMLREPWTWIVAGIGLVGAMAIALAWWNFSISHWAALLSSLVGLAVGGAAIWAVRLIGTGVLRKEAMGFGDVTLMAMIGAFVGWQPCLFIFFVAPFAGLVLGIVQMALRRDDQIPYGPFLCLATCLVVLAWPGLWQWALPLFELAWLVPTMMLVCFSLLLVLLLLLQGVKRLVFGRISATVEERK